MKKVQLLFFLIISHITLAQESASLSIIGEYSENFRWSNYSGGISLELPIEDWISVNYKITLGGSSDKAFYVHSPAGAAVGSVVLSSFAGSNTKFINGLGMILIAIPEGVTFYPNPEHKARIGIYASPLGLDYWKKRGSYEYFRFSGEVGGKIKYKIGESDIDLILHGGLRYIYNKKGIIEPLFLHGGAGVCINLN